jgi:RND family efflux transporter MFP subunit
MTEHSPKKHVGAKRVMMVLGLVALAFGAAAVDGIHSRAETEQTLTHWTDEQAVPAVALVKPTRGDEETTLRLPGSLSAFYTGTIYARASGYVHHWFFDIGAHVKKGDVLATIDSPDLDQQLAQAHADLATAQANQTLAQVTAGRWQALSKRDIVSQQATDEKVGDAKAKTSAVVASQANVDRLEALSAYKNITAPFDGVVTSRSLDIGDLVTAGSTSGKAMFTVSDMHKIRIYVRVPQAFLAGLKPGVEATLKLPQFPDQTFEAKLVSTANAFSENSRTALVQLIADNPGDALWPGAYAEVTFHIPTEANVMRVPATALIFGRRGMALATLKDDRVVMNPVKLGRNLGNDVEILSGISADQEVVNRPPETLTRGDRVRVIEARDVGRAPTQISEK